MLCTFPGQARFRARYDSETSAARRLKAASKEERAALYGEIYDDFLHQADHCTGREDAVGEQGRRLQLSLLEPFLKDPGVFLEIGCGDAGLALEVAAVATRVYAVEPSAAAVASVEFPANFHLIPSGSPELQLDDGSVNLAYSCHVIEHLHPDDARTHAREVHRVLSPGGRYVCVTPNRLLGPHDVSKNIDRTATGLHLREYTFSELADLLADAGFGRIRALRGIATRPTDLPMWPYRLAEILFASMPSGFRSALLGLVGGPEPFRALEQVVVMGVKSG